MNHLHTALNVKKKNYSAPMTLHSGYLTPVHFTHDINDFVEYQENEHKISITTATSSNRHAIGSEMKFELIVNKVACP